MSQTRITLKPRFWIFLLVVFSIVFILLYAAFDANYKAKQAEYQRLSDTRDALKQEVNDLRNEIDYVHSDEGLEQYARALGMIMPGEIKYNAVDYK